MKSLLALFCLSILGCNSTNGHKTMEELNKTTDISLLKIVQSGDKDQLLELLNKKPNLEIKDSEGRTALMIATYNADDEAAELLISAGADVNAQDNMLNSPFLYAGANGNVKILKMLRFGAKGYLLKDIEPGVLNTALDEVMEKGYYHSQKVSEALLHSLGRPDGDDLLSFKENEITFIQLASSEMTYKEIAEVMNLSPKTIDGYRQDLFNRLNIKNRVGLVMFALKNNIIKL